LAIDQAFWLTRVAPCLVHGLWWWFRFSSGLKIRCGQDEIKKAYRKAALKWHPDRNHGKEEEATAKFKEMQHAYTVLSDERERKWYDNHRDEILRGGVGGGGDVSSDEEESVGPQREVRREHTHTTTPPLQKCPGVNPV